MTDPIRIAYIGGGSRGWAWGLMGDLALQDVLEGEVRLYDIDHPAAEENAIIGNQKAALPEAKSRWSYTAERDLDAALEGADIVVISILPGTFDEMESDVHAPEKYGIYQPVGDTVGPGGVIRGLRTVPTFLRFGEAIARNAPDAWVINYTNPMTVCVRALYAAFPGIKAFGCCHEVFGTQGLLAKMAARQFEVEEPRRQDIAVNVVGINHFTWVTEASWGPHDLMPVYAEMAERYQETGFPPEEPDKWKGSVFGSKARVKLDLFRRHGAIAAAGDRHLVEFVGPDYLRDPETVAAWKFQLTPVSYRRRMLEEANARRARLVAGEEQAKLWGSGEEGVLQILALRGHREMLTNVNLPNRGQVEDLPAEAVVETNAVFRRNSLRPVLSGRLPASVAPLIRQHVDAQELLVEACREHDLEKAFESFLMQPTVTLGEADARALFDEMVENTRTWMDEAWFVPARA